MLIQVVDYKGGGLVQGLKYCMLIQVVDYNGGLGQGFMRPLFDVAVFDSCFCYAH